MTEVTICNTNHYKYIVITLVHLSLIHFHMCNIGIRCITVCIGAQFL